MNLLDALVEQRIPAAAARDASDNLHGQHIAVRLFARLDEHSDEHSDDHDKGIPQ
ncbi:hypothetical protein [Caballeronia sp.]|uniref:hypothetical protein n=1 Tax=Caballeronia sp. TaxID=1931223 RepID=UPI003C6EB12E